MCVCSPGFASCWDVYTLAERLQFLLFCSFEKPSKSKQVPVLTFFFFPFQLKKIKFGEQTHPFPVRPRTHIIAAHKYRVIWGLMLVSVAVSQSLAHWNPHIQFKNEKWRSATLKVVTMATKIILISCFILFCVHVKL